MSPVLVGKSAVGAAIVALPVSGQRSRWSVEAPRGPALVRPQACFVGTALLSLRGRRARVRLEVAVRHAAAVATAGLRVRWCGLGVRGSVPVSPARSEDVRGSLAADGQTAIVSGPTVRRESRWEAGMLDGRQGLLEVRSACPIVASRRGVRRRGEVQRGGRGLLGVDARSVPVSVLRGGSQRGVVSVNDITLLI